MKTLVTFVILTLAILMPVIAHYGFKVSGKKMRNILGINIFSFFGLLAVMTVVMWTGNVQVFAAGSESASALGGNGLGYIAASLSTGLACIGAGIAVSSAASAALGAISEDPKIMGKSLIFVALAEGIALYGLLISFMIIGQLG